jgi:hypothetical protein
MDSFYVTPNIYDIGNGCNSCETDVYDKILNMNKGSAIIVTGTAGNGKTSFLKKCFIDKFGKRKKNLIVFWLFPSLINKEKPKDQYAFYKKIIQPKYTKKNKVIVFIDGIDEIFINKKMSVIEYVEKLKEQKVCIVLGCRKNYYNRFLLDCNFSYKFEIKEWGESQIDDYIGSYLESKDKKDLVKNMVENNRPLKKFMINPFQIALLMYLIVDAVGNKVDDITNVYMLYNKFYNEWIFKEKYRCLSHIDVEDIKDVHFRIASKLYINYNKPVNIRSTLTKRQKEIGCYNDEAVLSLIKVSEHGLVDEYIAEGFIHESLAEFLLARNIIESFEKSGRTLYNSLVLTYRHFNLDFIEDGIASLPIEDTRLIKNNIEKVYVSLMPKEFVNKYYSHIDLNNNVRKKLLSRPVLETDIVRDQCLFFLGKLPDEYISGSNLFELAYANDRYILTRISAATVIINHNLNFEIEKDYITKLIENEEWERALRSWVLVFWEEVPFDNPYLYEDKGGDWTRVKQRRLGRIQLPYNPLNLKYMNTRAIDLTQLYIFFRNRGWNTMTEEEYQIISNCEIDFDIYSVEKKELLKYLKELFKKGWER